MSTTTKEEKNTVLDDLKAQAAALAAKIKEATDAHLETLHAKLKDAHALVQSLTAEIQKHTEKPVAAPAAVRRGRKAQGGTAKPAKAVRKAKGKRGSVGEAIKAFVGSKGKAGAHVKEIAAAIGNKPANVTAYFYANKKKNLKAFFKQVAPSTFALKK